MSFRWLVVMMSTVNIQAQGKASISVDSECLGNVLRVSTSPLQGNRLEVAVGYNNSTTVITSSLASQCGFSMKMDPLGSATIFASLQNCFAQTVDDHVFDTLMTLRLHGNRMVQDELYRVSETCHYPTWASREILCDRNFMEVSVTRSIPDDTLPTKPLNELSEFNYRHRAAKNTPGDAGFRMTTVVFFSPDKRPMNVNEAHRRGYGVTNTPTRLVLRSPLNAPETYTQDVAGVPMAVLKTSTIFEKKWLATQIDAAAACPIQTGGVSFTPDTISWFMPRHIDPLISSSKFQLLEVHMGVTGQRLDAAQMAARQYSMTVTDVHIIIEIPIGAVGGYFKSHIEHDQYLMSYAIELMLELLWTEDGAHEQTRYKVLLPVTTPLMSRPPQVIDDTIPEEKMFKLLLGPLAFDVVLVNITFHSGVLSVAECNNRGLNVQEHTSQNGSKTFTVEVSFMDSVVLKMKEMGTTIYALPLTFGLLVLPQFSLFSLSAYLEAQLVDIVPPLITGRCDHKNFYITVEYGTEGLNFQTIVGKRLLTPALAEQYGLVENGTHISLTILFSALDTVFEVIQASVIKSRIDVALKNPERDSNIQDFSLACSFPATLMECFTNGTMTALALKLEAVPKLNPSLLTLNDPACGPTVSDNSFAYFIFTASSCGTTRKFLPNAVVYENEISLPDSLQNELKMADDHDYELKISCYYDLDSTHTAAFLTTQRINEPFAEAAKGDLQVAMKLSLDESFTTFHQPEDYPVPKYLQQPLYFEVQLLSANPQVALELENCWATHTDQRVSQPRWNVIINGCPNPADPNKVIFHAVRPDFRVHYPSHLKRFEVQMFAFAVDQENLGGQLFFHCDVVICDSNNMSGPCRGQCPNQGTGIKGQRRAAPDVHTVKHVVSGPVLFTMPNKVLK